MSDLIERLRSNTWVMSCWITQEHLYAGMRSAMHEAADALEAQAKRIAELEADNARLRVDAENEFCKAIIATQFADEHRRGRLTCDCEELLAYFNANKVRVDAAKESA